MKLSLGVEDFAYSDPDAPGAVTTHQVAEILEAKYHVMEVFYELRKRKIAEDIGKKLSGTIKSIAQGKPVKQALNDVHLSAVEEMFKDYLSADEWQQVSGKVIMAARMGVTHRKGKKRRGSPRPAFIDTGTYQQSFRAMLTR